MKKSIQKLSTVLTCFIAILSPSAFAKTVNAEILCQHEDGDQWYEAAIVPSKFGHGFSLAVLKHDVDTDETMLIYSKIGYQKEADENSTIYTDEDGGVLLVGIKGMFVIKENSESILKVGGLICYKNTTIEIPNH